MKALTIKEAEKMLKKEKDPQRKMFLHDIIGQMYAYKNSCQVNGEEMLMKNFGFRKGKDELILTGF